MASPAEHASSPAEGIITSSDPLPAGFLSAPHDTLARFVSAETFLFDSDDTIYCYNPHFEHAVKRAALVELSDGIPKDVVRDTLHAFDTAEVLPMSPKATIREHLGETGVAAYYLACASLFESMNTPDSVIFDEGALSLIEYAHADGRGLGVISNNSAINGERILRYLRDKTGIDLIGRAVFMGETEVKKPHTEGFRRYTQLDGAGPTNGPFVYIGDIFEDLEFATNIGALGILHGAEARKNPSGDSTETHILVSDLMSAHAYLADTHPVTQSQP